MVIHVNTLSHHHDKECHPIIPYEMGVGIYQIGMSVWSLVSGYVHSPIAYLSFIDEVHTLEEAAALRGLKPAVACGSYGRGE